MVSPRGKTDWDMPLESLTQGKNGHSALTEVSSFTYHDNVPRGSYLSRLRFLASPRTTSDPKNHTNIQHPHSGGAGCVCSTYQPFTTSNYLSETPNLILTEPGALAGCKHYVAISYCWQQPVEVTNYDSGVPIPREYSIHTQGGVRANRAPPSVLHRSLMYAATYEFRFIWIDQESINQDDLVEKSHAVQQMNYIYRQAAQTVAVFSNTIMDQVHLDTVSRIGVDQGIHKVKEAQKNRESFYTKDRTPREGYREVVRLAEFLTADAWYSRAGTMQETCVAGGPLHFVIPCHQSLKRPSWMETNIPGHVILSEYFVQNCMSFKLGHEREFSDLWEDALQDQPLEMEDLKRYWQRGLICRKMIFNSPAYKFNGEVVQRPDLARLSAADGCKLLMSRGRLEPFDLIAIIANVCQYGIRFDTIDSLAGALSGTGVNLDDDLTECNAAASWRCRIESPILSRTGLLISGTLWGFASYIDFNDMPGIENWLQQWKVSILSFNQFGFWADLFWAILSHLASTELKDVAKAILSVFESPWVAPISDEKLQQLLLERRPGGWTTHERKRGVYNSYNTVQRIVNLVMLKRQLLFDEMESNIAKCTGHGPVYVLFQMHQGADPPLLFIPRREVIMSESDSNTPSFLFSCWVQK